jgi:hypothetical protein
MDQRAEYREPLQKLKVALFLDTWLNAVRYVLEQHGCTLDVHLDHCVVTFPDGTYRVENQPRTLDMRYDIYLPDGTRLAEIQPRGQISALGFNREELEHKKEAE